jgi:hypothetical protein
MEARLVQTIAPWADQYLDCKLSAHIAERSSLSYNFVVSESSEKKEVGGMISCPVFVLPQGARTP